MTETADAVVIGGGVMGCAILHGLAQRGVTDTLLLEQGVLASGSTGRSQGILRMHYSNPVTTRMVWESLRIYREFGAAVGGESGYVDAGYLLIVDAADGDALVENVAMQAGIGVRTQVVDSGAVAELAPAIRLSGNEVCAYEAESGYADPYLVTHSYARRAVEMGARTRTHTVATGVEVERGRVVGVTTPDGSTSTRLAVVAAGPWSRPFWSRLGLDLPLETVRHQVVVLRRPESQIPTHPVLGDVVNSLSARPEVGGLTLAAVGEEERAGPDELDHGVDAPVVESVAARLTSRIPAMSEAVFRGGWSGLFTVTPDWHPVLDRAPGVEGLYLAVGFSGHGFKLAPMVGAAMAEMAVEGTATTIDISELSLSRFAEGRPMRSRYRMSVLA